MIAAVFLQLLSWIAWIELRKLSSLFQYCCPTSGAFLLFLPSKRGTKLKSWTDSIKAIQPCRCLLRCCGSLHHGPDPRGPSAGADTAGRRRLRAGRRRLRNSSEPDGERCQGVHFQQVGKFSPGGPIVTSSSLLQCTSCAPPRTALTGYEPPPSALARPSRFSSAIEPAATAVHPLRQR